jgi:hypothetical protein
MELHSYLQWEGWHITRTRSYKLQAVQDLIIISRLLSTCSTRTKNYDGGEDLMSASAGYTLVVQVYRLTELVAAARNGMGGVGGSATAS